MLFKRLKIRELFLLLALMSAGTAFASTGGGISPSGLTAEQSEQCSGVVTDSKGEPLIGVAVSIKGTTIGVSTDLDGKFILSDAKIGDVLLVQSIGYKNVEVTWNGNPVEVVLEEDSELLEEVVVVGFGTQKKVDLTGAVASVDTKALDSRPVTSVGQALQGVVPGLNISMPSNGGRLDSSPSFNIRGQGNLGTGSSASPLILIDGVEGDINSLNPQDIANISVLMDAASSAIYGSRAPFGVILVTTKRGEKGKASITYSNNFRWSRPTRIPDMLDSYRWAMYMNRGQVNNGQEDYSVINQTTIENIQRYMAGEITTTCDMDAVQDGKFPFNTTTWANENWPRNFLDKTAFGQEHNVSVSGGSDRIQYYVSGAFMSQGGQLNYADESKHRYNVSGRVSADITKWLRIEFNSRFTREQISMPSYIKLNGDTFFQEITKLHPNMPLTDPNGHYTRNPKIPQLQQGGRSDTTEDTYFTQGSLILTPVKGLTINADLAFRGGSYQNKYNKAKVYLYDKNNNPMQEQWQGGSATEAAGQTMVYSETWQNQLITSSAYAEYAATWGRHNFKAMAGYNSESYLINNMNMQRTDVISDLLPTINTATGETSGTNTMSDWSTLGYFARINYNFDERYLLQFSFRRDGSSRFRRGHRWVNSPSVSVAWNIANEPFWGNAKDWVNLLKIRGSWGSLGNQNTDNWYPTYATQGFTVGSATTGSNWLLSPDSKSNSAGAPGLVATTLTWEKIYSYNVGLDWGAFNNRFTGYFNWFIRDTKDMVGPAEEISPIVGASAPSLNNTSLRTRGWELQLEWRDNIGDFNYNVAFNLSDSRTFVTEYPNASNSLNTYYVGQEIGEIWGYVTEGLARTDEEMAAHLEKVDQSRLEGTGGWGAGDIMYKDVDGNGQIDTGESQVGNSGDWVKIGNNTPRFRFGLNIGGEYKGLDFSIFFQGVGKRDYWLEGMGFWGQAGDLWSSTAYEAHWDFFRPEGDPLGANVDAYYPRPRFTNGQNRQRQSRYLQDASYIRLKNVQVGYTLPQHITRKAAIEKLRIFFSADNIWTGTSLCENYDPEALSNNLIYPLSFTLSCGINLTF